jgi:hypothetical protein
MRVMILIGLIIGIGSFANADIFKCGFDRRIDGKTVRLTQGLIDTSLGASKPTVLGLEPVVADGYSGFVYAYETDHGYALLLQVRNKNIPVENVLGEEGKIGPRGVSAYFYVGQSTLYTVTCEARSNQRI